MNTPIKFEDIRDGDRIRMITAYTAGVAGSTIAYELISRPVTLPDVPGLYSDKDGDIWRCDEDGLWRIIDFQGKSQELYAPFTLLRPVAEVAVELLAEVMAAFAWHLDDGAMGPLKDRFDEIAAKWASK